MPGAMNEILPETGLVDVIAGSPIHFPAGDLAAFLNRRFYLVDACVACAPNYFENLALAIGGRPAHKTGPGNIVINRAGRVLLGPDIEQHEIAFPNGTGACSRRLIMGISAISVHRDNGRVFGDQVFPREGFHEPLLDFMLGGPAVAHLAPNFLEGFRDDAINQITGLKVRLNLCVGQGCFELGNQVGGTDYVLAQTPHHLHRAAIHQRNIKDDVVWRILHGDVTIFAEQRLQILEQLLPRRILPLAAG